jgi:hypothetical protein
MMARQRSALLAAFGMSDAAAPDRFLIALAAVELLADTGARSPVLLIVEDAQWLDRPTGDVLAFVARRLESEPIVLPAAIREGHTTPLGEAGLPEVRLGHARRPLAALPDGGGDGWRDHRGARGLGRRIVGRRRPTSRPSQRDSTPGSAPVMVRPRRRPAGSG